jgi:FdhD protein
MSLTQSSFPSNRPVREVVIEKIVDLTAVSVRDSVAIEEPLEIQLVYGERNARVVKSITVTMRTPGHDSELAAGFLFTEGVVRNPDEIERVFNPLGDRNARAQSRQKALSHDESHDLLDDVSKRNTVRVELAPGVAVNLATLERNFYTTSSCGICGKASLLALHSICPPRYRNEFVIQAEILHRLPNVLREEQQVFESTGGLHGAGLFDSQGRLLMLREDVGRHNAVDKLLGAQFLDDATPLRDKLLLLSGRASFELLQKAVMAGIPMVAAVGAPSSLAVRVAREFDITLVGFLRENRFNIYHGAGRILIRV